MRSTSLMEENEKPENTFRNTLIILRNSCVYLLRNLCQFSFVSDFLLLLRIFHFLKRDHHICIIQQQTKNFFWFQWPTVHGKHTNEEGY